MARKSGVMHAMVKAQREAEQSRAREYRTQAQMARDAERLQRERMRAQAADERLRRQLYAEARAAEVDDLNKQLSTRLAELEGVLAHTLTVDDYFDLDQLKERPSPPPFDPRGFDVAESPPLLEYFMPPQPGVVGRLLPGAKEKYARQVEEANERFQHEVRLHSEREEARIERLAKLRAEYEELVARIHDAANQRNSAIDEFKTELGNGDPDAIVNYFSLVLEASSYPDGFPSHARLAFVPESSQLVVEIDLPPIDIVPDVASYRYVKTKDEIASTARPMSQRKALYASIVAQTAIRTLHELFESDRHAHIDSIVLNGHVDAIDPGTGRLVRPCLVTVRTTRDAFLELDLSRVDPTACLKTLNASVSKSPMELAPVRPVLEFNMVDSRFIEETDVLSTLDQRPNLMDLSPLEFEALISNLFQKMGLETRQTQASRDGGVDCVAFDPRPIFGGKVVIQAKRYKDTVGVSAVRDLYGTVQNEGASKGILVATSGYGTAAFEFAEGKPLELLSGSHLLHLLHEHAGIDAKIVMPVD